MDTNGDGVVDELDTQTPATDNRCNCNASSTDEIQMDTNGDGVVDELDTTAGDTNGDGVVDAADQRQQIQLMHPLLMKSRWIPMVME